MRGHYLVTTICSLRIRAAPVNQDFQTARSSIQNAQSEQEQNLNMLVVVSHCPTCGKQTGMPPLMALGGFQIACTGTKGMVRVVALAMKLTFTRATLVLKLKQSQTNIFVKKFSVVCIPCYS